MSHTRQRSARSGNVRFPDRRRTELLKSAKDAEGKGDLASAEHFLTEAVEYANKQKGALWAQWQQLSRQRMAEVLFKSGQLDRTASLAFEILQQGRAAT